MLHVHSPFCAERVSVVLCGVHLPRRRDVRLLKTQAAVEALRLLRNMGAGWQVWSHAFRFEGSDFLLSTHLQAARDVNHRANGRRAKMKRLAARLVIEIAPAPEGLTARMLIHRPGSASSKGRKQRAESLGTDCRAPTR